MRSCTEILRGNLKGVNIVSCRSEELVDSFPWLRKFEQIHGNDMDQTNIKRGDKVQVVKLECMYFITVYLWTTIGSNSMGGGGGGANKPGTYVCILSIQRIFLQCVSIRSW